jgi:hypothetical protein
MNTFQKAVKEQEKLRLALEGPAGSGKTYTAQRVLRALLGPDGKIAALDTERRSMRKYASDFDFDVLEIEPPFHPQKLIDAITEAQALGYDGFLIDSLSHFWNEEGGMLQIVEQVAKAKYKGNTFTAWNDPDTGGLQKRLVNSILGARMHVVATMRTKTDYVVEENERGKAAPRKVGTKTIQRAEFDYEFDVIGRLDTNNVLTVTKTRCSALTGAFFDKPGEELAEILSDWLGNGESTDPTDEQRARLAAALKAGAKLDSERFSEGRVEALAAALYGRSTDLLVAREYEKVVAKIEAAVLEAEAAKVAPKTQEPEPVTA